MPATSRVQKTPSVYQTRRSPTKKPLPRVGEKVAPGLTVVRSGSERRICPDTATTLGIATLLEASATIIRLFAGRDRIRRKAIAAAAKAPDVLHAAATIAAETAVSFGGEAEHQIIEEPDDLTLLGPRVKPSLRFVPGVSARVSLVPTLQMEEAQARLRQCVTREAMFLGCPTLRGGDEVPVNSWLAQRKQTQTAAAATQTLKTGVNETGTQVRSEMKTVEMQTIEVASSSVEPPPPYNFEPPPPYTPKPPPPYTPREAPPPYTQTPPPAYTPHNTCTQTPPPPYSTHTHTTVEEGTTLEGVVMSEVTLPVIPDALPLSKDVPTSTEGADDSGYTSLSEVESPLPPESPEYEAGLLDGLLKDPMEEAKELPTSTLLLMEGLELL